MFDRRVFDGVPGVESARAALEADIAALNRADAVTLMVGCERLVRLFQAVLAETMVVVAGPKPVPLPVSETSGLAVEPVDEAGEEAAAALGGNRTFQVNRVDTARFLQAWLPETAVAMRAGSLGWYEAQLIQ